MRVPSSAQAAILVDAVGVANTVGGVVDLGVGDELRDASHGVHAPHDTIARSPQYGVGCGGVGIVHRGILGPVVGETVGRVVDVGDVPTA